MRILFHVRALMVPGAIAGSLMLAGCQIDGPVSTSRSLQPLSPQMLSLLDQKSMTKDGPVLVRIFKEESELEVWKQDRSGQMALLKTYPICRWSGELGPKIREGDRQAPEGFYSIAPGQMNPNSSLYLSFNLGFPNTFDQAHGRTGTHLMVHGDCSSRGCYALTDEQITEVYALAREAFFGGQQAFQVQAYPFRMTPKNMARHRGNPNMPFWKNLKDGYDHFEVARAQPTVDVCERRYVFNARAPGHASRELAFNPAGRCPAYEIPQDIASALAAKKQQDELKTAEHVRSGVAAAPIKTNADGGMHRVFLAKLKPAQVQDAEGIALMSSFQSPPGTIPPHANPPGEPRPVWASETTASVVQQPGTNRAPARGPVAPNHTKSDASARAAVAHPATSPAPNPARRESNAAPPNSAALLPGAAPVVPATTFEGRWISPTR